MSRTATQTARLNTGAVWQGSLILVNPLHPLRHPPAANTLAQVAPGVLLERRAAAIFGRVMQQVGGAGRIRPVSGWRSHAQQRQIYESTAQSRGAEYAATYVALPGCSEHESGLAVDMALCGEAADPIAPGFPYEGISQAFRVAALRHGFIERYPKGRQAVTQIGHEPWHFRYVGMPHAELMAQKGLVLEEYIDWLRGFPLETEPYSFCAGGHRFAVGFVPAQKAGCTPVRLRGTPYTLSGNNVDGFVACCWEGRK